MITRVIARNFRSLAQVDVRLSRLNVLVGRNGAGKSNFVDVLRLFRDVMRVGLEDAILNRDGIGSVRRWAPRKPYDLELGIEFQGVRWHGEYSFVIGGASDGGYKVKSETCKVHDKHGELVEHFETKNCKWEVLPERFRRRAPRLSSGDLDPHGLALSSLAILSPHLQYLRRELRGSFHSVFPNTIREPQKPSDVKQLSDNCENLGSVLRQLIREKRWYGDLKSTINAIVGNIRDVRVREAGGYLVVEFQHSDIGTSDDWPWFPASQESDGTLRALGMLVAMYQSASGRGILCFEEPEAALHPGALAVLRDVILETGRRRQTLVTTQSPDLVSRFPAIALTLVERKGGATIVSPLNEETRSVIQEDLFSAGDLLRIDGFQTPPPGQANA